MSDDAEAPAADRDTSAEILEMYLQNVDARFDQAVEHSKSFRMQTLFAIQQKEPLDLDEGLRLFSLLDFTKTKDLTKKEILDGCTHKIKKHAEVLAFLDKHENTPLGLLKNKRSIDKVFARVDKDGDGKIVFHEWKLFLAELIERDLEYLVEKGWASDNCYWARHPPTDPEPRFFFFCTTEWLSDFWYFECNNNPLLGIFFADKNNTLQTLERLNIEFCCGSWALLMTAILAQDPSRNVGSQYILLFVVVTLPLVFIRNVLLYCFKCPCLVRRHHMSCWRRCCIPCLERAGHFVGLLTFCAAVIVLVLGILVALRLRHSRAFWWDFVVSVGMGFVYEFFYDLLVPFNPLVTMRCMVEKRRCLCFPFKVAGLAQWQRQRKAAMQFYHDRKRSAASEATVGAEMVEVNTNAV